MSWKPWKYLGYDYDPDINAYISQIDGRAATPRWMYANRTELRVIDKPSVGLFKIGKVYTDKAGRDVLIVGISNKGKHEETVYSIGPDGKVVHRYNPINRPDCGRVTGTAFDFSDDRNLPNHIGGKL